MSDISKRLEFISTNLIAEINQSYFLGKDATLQTASSSSFINHLLTYATFSTKWLPTISSTVTVSEILNQVYLTAKAGDSWISASDLTASNKDSYNTNSVTFNFTNALKVSTGKLAGAAVVLNTTQTDITQSFVNLLELLDTMRVTYNLLEDTKFKSFKAQETNLEINKYSCVMTSNKPVYEKVSGINNVVSIATRIIPNVLKLDHNSSNLLAIRRMLLGYEAMIHSYLALHILNTTEALNNTKVVYLIDSTINKLIKMNDTTYDKSSGINTIQQNLNGRISEYNNKRQRIDEVDKVVSDSKLNIVVENNNVTSNMELLKKNSYAYYTFLSLFIVFLVVLLIAQQGAEQPSGQMKLIVGVIFALSVVGIVVMYFINRTYLRESFVGNDVSNLISFYQTSSLLPAFDQYLANTIYVALLLGTYRRYGDISHAMNKEFYYYDDLTTQLKQSKEKLNNMQVQDYRMSKILQYRVYLFLQILIIISIVVFINLYTGTSNYLLAFMIFTILFMVYMYMINTNNLVHTDARKLYWNQPSSEMLN